MTCKVSFFNSIRANLRHHIASTFVSALAFFIQFLIFFLQIQNIVGYEELYDRSEILSVVEPNYIYYGFVCIVAIILAFDHFRYLHSKKQLDFFESLPLKRRDWFMQKTAACFFVFFIPFIICMILECVALLAYGYTDLHYYAAILWTVICMVLIYFVTWLSAALAMILTGHPVVATLFFSLLCGYAPVLLYYLFPLYAKEYFETYITSHNYFLTYISPIGIATNLIGRDYHTWVWSEHINHFSVLVCMILVLLALTYKLFLKRPSEAAGRAMTFENWNPLVRILLVIPLSLYLGLYLSNVTYVGTTVWMIVGFILGVILLHGIIESIFQFDIRGLWSHKLQMLSCLIATIAIACIFWFDLFAYDTYIPKFDKLASIELKLNDPYFYNYSEIDGLHDENLEYAYELIENVVSADYDETDSKVIHVTYVMDNGVKTERRYFLNLSDHIDLIDKIYASKDYKNDICELYNIEFDSIFNLEWIDGVTSYPLILNAEEQNKLFNTYLAELTPLTYSEIMTASSYGNIAISSYDEIGNKNVFHCELLSTMTESISILEDLLKQNSISESYGSLSLSALERYEINSIDFYFDEGPASITDPEIIAILKPELILAEEYYMKHGGYDEELFYDGTVELLAHNGRNYLSVLIPREVAKDYIN